MAHIFVNTVLNKWYYRDVRPRLGGDRPRNIFDRDWDNLVILDACRYDAFEQVYDDYDLDGELTTTRSRGSCTRVFITENGDGRDLGDTVYVTANPVPYNEAVREGNISLRFHDVVDVWTEDYEGVGDEFGDLNRELVNPDRLVEAARAAEADYPDKRILVHAIQPHQPFLTEDRDDVFGDEGNVWTRIEYGDLEVPQSVLWDQYIENLRVVMPYAADLAADLQGKTVVTADHGQYLGERIPPLFARKYSHPCNVNRDELVRVPWFACAHDERKEIEPGRAREYADLAGAGAEAAAEEHLRRLGYT